MADSFLRGPHPRPSPRGERGARPHPHPWRGEGASSLPVSKKRRTTGFAASSVAGGLARRCADGRRGGPHPRPLSHQERGDRKMIGPARQRAGTACYNLRAATKNPRRHAPIKRRDGGLSEPRGTTLLAASSARLLARDATSRPSIPAWGRPLDLLGPRPPSGTTRRSVRPTARERVRPALLLGLHSVPGRCWMSSGYFSQSPRAMLDCT